MSEEIGFQLLSIYNATHVQSAKGAADKDAAFSVDEIVYKPYTPRDYGRVLAIGWSSERRFSGRPFYRVRWKDGRENWVWEVSLKSLEKLLADHERKLATHRKNIAKGKEL
jgi:hypothetical protein